MNIYMKDMKTQLNNEIRDNIVLFFKNHPELFYQWLVFFVDGEGNLQINPFKYLKGKITKFSFIFNISFHIDDKDVLFTII